MDAQQVLNQLESDGIEHVWAVYHDYHGRSAAKSVPPERFANLMESGVIFTPANLDMTVADHQVADAMFLADAGDFWAVPDPDTYSVVPYREATARMHVFMRKEGEMWEGCPRTQLQHMLNIYASEGLTVRAGFEAEFTMFTKTAEGEYAPADRTGMFTLAGLDQHNDLWRDVVNTLRAMDVTVTQMGNEYGPGQYELNTRHAPAMKAVDDYLTLKEVVRALAREAGWIATFMPKPYVHLPGNGLHVHMSLMDGDGNNDLSIGETDDEPLSPLGRHFMGGLLAHARALAGIGAPIMNSYKRLLPGSWSPAHICWAVGNRAALVRIPGMGARRHFEYRSGDNACNPFMYLTALLAAGMDGIRNQIEPPDSITEDVGHLSTEQAAAQGLELLPRNLPEALAAFESDEIISEALGPILSSEFLKLKRTELAEYDLHVHPFERQLYLEAI